MNASLKDSMLHKLGARGAESRSLGNTWAALLGGGAVCALLVSFFAARFFWVAIAAIAVVQSLVNIALLVGAASLNKMSKQAQKETFDRLRKGNWPIYLEKVPFHKMKEAINACEYNGTHRSAILASQVPAHMANKDSRRLAHIDDFYNKWFTDKPSIDAPACKECARLVACGCPAPDADFDDMSRFVSCSVAE